MFCLCLVVSFTTLAPCTLIVASLLSNHCFTTLLPWLLLHCLDRCLVVLVALGFATLLLQSFPCHFIVLFVALLVAPLPCSLHCCLPSHLATSAPHYLLDIPFVAPPLPPLCCFVPLLLHASLFHCLVPCVLISTFAPSFFCKWKSFKL
jgi:hypothetical protein